MDADYNESTSMPKAYDINVPGGLDNVMLMIKSMVFESDPDSLLICLLHPDPGGKLF